MIGHRGWGNTVKKKFECYIFCVAVIIRSNPTTDGPANKNKSQLLVPINSVSLTWILYG